MKDQNISKVVFVIISFFILLGIFIRVYNINYDNFWFDEIISFWVSDPEISIKESYSRHLTIERVPFLYNLLLKFFFELFNYDITNARYLSLVFNILSIICIVKISKSIKENGAYIFCLFLLCANIYLIIYSQELRAYSLVLFLCSLNILLFFRSIQKKYIKKINIYSLLVNISAQILMIISHPFTLIILFSMIIFLLIKYFKFSVSFKDQNFSILVASIFSCCYLFFYTKSIDVNLGWIEQPGLKFYTNFYFSSFFGSRFLGLIHLIILIFLLVFFQNKIRRNFFDLNFFLIIIFLSYFLPILYGYIFVPIIFHRFIIFVLIPIIVLISFLIYEIKNELIKKTIITLFIILTLGNLYTEATIQQFIKKRPHYKPDFTKSINEINQSSQKYYTFNLSFPAHMESSAFASIENYISKLSRDNKINIKYLSPSEFNNSDKRQIWAICLTIITKNKCNDLNPIFNAKIVKIKNFTAINLKLIHKID